MNKYQPKHASAPYLLFRHGTASKTLGSFGGIVAGKQIGLSINHPQTEEWKTIVSKYRGRILALEYKALSLSPIENTLELAEALPDIRMRMRMALLTSWAANILDFWGPIFDKQPSSC